MAALLQSLPPSRHDLLLCVCVSSSYKDTLSGFRATMRGRMICTIPVPSGDRELLHWIYGKLSCQCVFWIPTHMPSPLGELMPFLAFPLSWPHWKCYFSEIPSGVILPHLTAQSLSWVAWVSFLYCHLELFELFIPCMFVICLTRVTWSFMRFDLVCDPQCCIPKAQQRSPLAHSLLNE